MNKINYRPFHLMIEFYGRAFQFGEVSVNENKEEFFYRFIRKEDNLEHSGFVQSIDYSESHDFKSGEIEHISFHNDGSTHLKLKKYKSLPKHYEKGPSYSENILDDVNKKNVITPLLIDSILLTKGSYDLHKTRYSKKKGSPVIKDINGRVCGYIWSLEKKMNFSAILLLIPKSISNVGEWQRNHILNKIAYSFMDPPAVLIDLPKGVKLMVILSSLIASNPYNSSEKINNNGKDKQHRGFIFVADWKDLNQMQ